MYPEGVQKGIALHRGIDQFTDEHRATRAAKLFFRPTYRLYAGAFVDVVYDHFLATDLNEFVTNTDLENFSKKVYEVLEENSSYLPPGFKKMLPYMKMQNWLCNYQYTWGIEKSFLGLVHRAAYLTESEIAFSIFNNHYQELKECYEQFFPELKRYASIELSNLLTG